MSTKSKAIRVLLDHPASPPHDSPPQIAGAQITRSDGHLEVSFDPALLRAADLVVQLQRAGWPLAVRTHRLVVTDMHCASCAGAIERGLRKLPGVVDAELTFATERCEIVYQPAMTGIKQVKARITDIGFGALEEDEAAAREEAQVRDLRLQQRRLVTAWLLGGPIFVLMGAGWLGFQHLVPGESTVMFALATPLLAATGWPYYRAAWQALRYGRTATTDVLISLGFSAAFFYSVAAYFLGRPTYFDTSAMVLTFVTTGKYLKVRATATSSQAVRRLVGLQARTAHRVTTDGSEADVAIDAIAVGDTLAIRPGERIPLDGTVATGSTVVDESMLTGESFQVPKTAGAKVLAGTLNRSQPIRITVDKIGRDTTLAQIIRLLDETQAGKPKVLDLSDKISAVFVPVVLTLAGVTFAVWLALGAGPGGALAHAVAVLVIACPCAVSLAPGTAIAVATGEAARRGTLIKGPAVLERLQLASVIVFDKTGTLTQGSPTVTAVYPEAAWQPEELLALAAAAETGSEHPLAEAIRTAARTRGLALPDGVESDVVPGNGVRAYVDGRTVAVGSPRFLTDQTDSEVTWSIPSDGQITVGIAIDGGFAGTLELADPLRPEAHAVVSELARRGNRVVMLTGDQHPTAAAVAVRLGITDIRAEVLPADKVAAIRELQRDGVVVAMVGDGLNDAAALAQADIGVAIGAGADVAAEASDLTLLRDDLTGVLDAITLSRRAYRIIIQNFVYAFCFNGIGLPVAAAGFLSPVFAAASMGVSSIAVVTNSLRLRTQHAVRPQLATIELPATGDDRGVTADTQMSRVDVRSR